MIGLHNLALQRPFCVPNAFRTFAVFRVLRAFAFSALRNMWFVALFTGILISLSTLKADEYEDALMKFLNVSQTNAALNQMLDDKQALNALYAEYGDKLSKSQKNQIAQAYNEYMSGAYNDMLSVMPRIYKKYLSLDDLNELIKFYQTPLGKKLAKMQVSMVNEDLTPLMIQILQKHLPIFQQKFQAILGQ